MRHTGFNVAAAALVTLVVNMAETLSSIPSAYFFWTCAVTVGRTTTALFDNRIEIRLQ